ncbi:MAG TPA: hypothetical protein VKP64_12910 [Mycobacteriales bacterium]|nr:hypothetical protein [Mycobacteriales bacterium]
MLVIPLPAATTSTWDDATAIAARVRPELDRLELDRVGLAVRTIVVRYDDSPDRTRRERRALAAVERAARRLRATAVVSAAPSLSWSAHRDAAVPDGRQTARDVDQLQTATVH